MKDYEQELKDIGCPAHLQEEYKELAQTNKWKERIMLLRKVRSMVLDDLHKCNREIDCIDYIIQELQGEMERNNG